MSTPSRESSPGTEITWSPSPDRDVVPAPAPLLAPVAPQSWTDGIDGRAMLHMVESGDSEGTSATDEVAVASWVLDNPLGQSYDAVVFQYLMDQHNQKEEYIRYIFAHCIACACPEDKESSGASRWKTIARGTRRMIIAAIAPPCQGIGFRFMFDGTTALIKIVRPIPMKMRLHGSATTYLLMPFALKCHNTQSLQRLSHAETQILQQRRIILVELPLCRDLPSSFEKPEPWLLHTGFIFMKVPQNGQFYYHLQDILRLIVLVIIPDDWPTPFQMASSKRARDELKQYPGEWGLQRLRTRQHRTQHSSPYWQQVSVQLRLTWWTAVHQIARKDSLSSGRAQVFCLQKKSHHETWSIDFDELIFSALCHDILGAQCLRAPEYHDYTIYGNPLDDGGTIKRSPILVQRCGGTCTKESPKTLSKTEFHEYCMLAINKENEYEMAFGTKGKAPMSQSTKQSNQSNQSNQTKYPTVELQTTRAPDLAGPSSYISAAEGQGVQVSNVTNTPGYRVPDAVTKLMDQLIGERDWSAMEPRAPTEKQASHPNQRQVPPRPAPAQPPVPAQRQTPWRPISADSPHGSANRCIDLAEQKVGQTEEPEANSTWLSSKKKVELETILFDMDVPGFREELLPLLSAPPTRLPSSHQRGLSSEAAQDVPYVINNDGAQSVKRGKSPLQKYKERPEALENVTLRTGLGPVCAGRRVRNCHIRRSSLRSHMGQHLAPLRQLVLRPSTSQIKWGRHTIAADGSAVLLGIHGGLRDDGDLAGEGDIVRAQLLQANGLVGYAMEAGEVEEVAVCVFAEDGGVDVQIPPLLPLRQN
ncbi:hypothetical protein CNMCM5793_007418 [Aspergillus hiratsukae]|uniref:Uncharacterized protein n=1 Tax=Aspergillus hiratsukae TaxID=1194566 RepID=A0A8H6P633_9EURO|nr:hypothetical protein CNMCM5793_007418 [Aspergillus hiratsukae]